MNKTDRLLGFVKQIRPLSEVYGQKPVIESVESAIAKLGQNTTLLFCGEFKRGKSSLINAILNEGICPTDVGIATATVTKIKYGADKRAIRYFGNTLGTADSLKSEEVEWEDIPKYTMGNLDQLDNTVYMELSYPSTFLKENNLTIIDTPGVGGLDPRHASLTCMAIPEADCVVFVTDANEPLTESEVLFYKDKIASTHKNNLVLVNKSDVLTADLLEKHIETTTQTLAKTDCSSIIPVSALNWTLYSQIGGDDLLKASNKENVLGAIIAMKESHVQNSLTQLRDNLISAVENICKAIDTEIGQLQSDSTSQQESLDALINTLTELSKSKQELQNPSSPIRLQISSVFENARNEVSNHISHESTLISTTLFNQYLNDERSLTNEGRWLIAQINDRLTDLSNQVDDLTNKAFEEIAEKLSKEILDDVQQKLEQIDGNVHFSGTFNSQLIFSAASKLTISGIVATTAYGIVAGITGFVGLGVLAGVAAFGKLLWDRLYAETKERKKAELRQQIPPQIAIAVTDLRNNAMTRFTKYNQNLLMTIQNVIDDTEQRMKVLRDSMQQAKSSNNARKERLEELDKKKKLIETIKSQLSLLYTNPFNGTAKQSC